MLYQLSYARVVAGILTRTRGAALPALSTRTARFDPSVCLSLSGRA